MESFLMILFDSFYNCGQYFLIFLLFIFFYLHDFIRFSHIIDLSLEINEYIFIDFNFQSL